MTPKLRSFLYEPLRAGTDEEDIPSVLDVGGKGRGLYWLAAHDFPAPPTWVLSTGLFDIAIEELALESLIANIWVTMREIDHTDWAAVQRILDVLEPQRLKIIDALAQISNFGRASLSMSALPQDVTHWAVRSSATVEDNPRFSFAGQFLSLLYVPKGAAMWDAIRRVWTSTFSREVLAYCAQNATPLPRMAVVLQPMASVKAEDRSGVAFSHSPVPSLPGVLIQASYGTGQVVVSGRGGDLFSVEGEYVRPRRMPPDQIMVTGPDGGVVAQTPPSKRALSDAEAVELARLVSAISEQWGGPVNVEFIWRAGQYPLIVQARSATDRFM